MDPLATWEKLLLGAFALLLIFWFRPGLKAAFQRSAEAENKDWMGLLIPLALVIGFVLLLISMV
ncbi:MAG TPA: hypothetical protein ENI94_08905 [Gammaproteobacteria bacterium]|nr:hypothetical protein [Gammaproteobacteria bacterium]